MFFRNRATPPNRLLSLGLIALIVASVGSYLMGHKLGVPDSITDPVSGFLYGVAIAALLLGIRAQARAQRGTS